MATARRTQATERAERRSRREEGSLFGVPERFMRPRLVLIAVTAVLVGFGMLMVYSASSVTALSATGDAAYYLKRQALFAAAGMLPCLVLVKLDYHLWARTLINVVWVVTVGLLIMVLVAGTDNDMGASRWIELGFFQLQPSEFAKLTVVFTAANVAERYFEEASIDWNQFLKLLVGGVGVPLALIILQPDKGCVMVLGVTLVVMGYLAGIPKRLLLIFLGAGLLGFIALSMKDDYSRQRLLTMLDPWSDPYDTGYQLIQGFYAFGSGGLTGVGIGMSTQKYSYLPMAHNDFIFAVIGEECGLVGTVGLLAGFAIFAWAGFRIARYAPDLSGRLVAAGCTTLVIVQLLLNVSGVLGIFPLSGKPIPFVSYGGSSIIASLMLVGTIVSVSVHSHLPETAYDGARRSWQLAGGQPAPGEATPPGSSSAGEARPRSARRGAPAATAARDEGTDTRRAAFTVMDGGRTSERRRGSASSAPSRGRTSGRGAGGAGRRERIDLGPSATDRLRGRGDGPRTRR